MRFRYTLNNLDCADCALSIETHLKKIGGFEDALVNFGTSTLTVSSSDTALLQKEIAIIDSDVVIVSDTGRGKSSFNFRQILKEHSKELLLIATSAVLLSVLLSIEETLHTKGYTL